MDYLSKILLEEVSPTMMHAYQEIYVNKVQKSLGTAFDYAINTCGIPGAEFIKLFIVSSISKRIENG